MLIFDNILASFNALAGHEIEVMFSDFHNGSCEKLNANEIVLKTGSLHTEHLVEREYIYIYFSSFPLLFIPRTFNAYKMSLCSFCQEQKMEKGKKKKEQKKETTIREDDEEKLTLLTRTMSY